jgi:Fur family transcriptional regulator, iron response regulator
MTTPHEGISLARLLREAGLRATRPRRVLAELLFAKGNRHVTAEMLYEETMAAQAHVSLATVYNTLNQLTEAGLLRQVGIDGSKSFFDTNMGEHHHYFLQDKDAILDIPADAAVPLELPPPPEGFEIARVDVVVRLRPR